MRTRPKRFPKVLAVVALAALAGCAGRVQLNTAADLAAALKGRGIAYETTEPLDFSAMRVAKIDEGLGLTGEKLKVVILRITDDRTYKLAASAGFLVTVVKAKEPDLPDTPADLYLSKPFVVIIRAEPAPGQVRGALKKFLREDSPKK